MWRTIVKAIAVLAAMAVLLIFAAFSYRAAMLVSGSLLVLAIAVATRRMAIVVVLAAMLCAVPVVADGEFRFTLASIMLATFGVLLCWWWIDSLSAGTQLRELVLGAGVAVVVGVVWFSATSSRVQLSLVPQRNLIGFNDVSALYAAYDRAVSENPRIRLLARAPRRSDQAALLFNTQAARGLTDRQILRAALQATVRDSARGRPADPLLLLELSWIARSRIHLDGAKEAEFLFTPLEQEQSGFILEGRMYYSCAVNPDPEYCANKAADYVYRRTAGPVEVESVRKGFLLRVARIDSLIGCATRCPPTRVRVFDLPKDAFLQAAYSDSLLRSPFASSETVRWIADQPDHAIAFSYIIDPWQKYRRVVKPFIGLQGVEDWMWALAVLLVGAFLWMGKIFLLPVAVEVLKSSATAGFPASARKLMQRITRRPGRKKAEPDARVEETAGRTDANPRGPVKESVASNQTDHD